MRQHNSMIIPIGFVTKFVSKDDRFSLKKWPITGGDVRWNGNNADEDMEHRDLLLTG